MALLPNFKKRHSFPIRAYDIDNQKKVTVPALVKLMHEAAMNNAIDLKLSVWDLAPYGVSWVLMRKKITVHRLPEFGEEIQVQTYPAGFEKFFTYRDYLVYDAQNQLIAQAATTWLVMDLKTRKMTRIPKFILALETPDPATCLPRLPMKLPKFGTLDLQQKFKVGWYDLDFNMHLNNIYYLQWVLETLPDNIMQQYQLKEMNVLYKLECKWKEEVVCETEQLDEAHFRHRLVRQSDGKEVVQAETKWIANDISKIKTG